MNGKLGWNRCAVPAILVISHTLGDANRYIKSRL